MGKPQKKLSPWIKFVMDVKKKNPTLKFKDVLKKASTLKKKGLNAVDYVKTKTEKATKKVNKTFSMNKKSNKGKKKRRKTSRR